MRNILLEANYCYMQNFLFFLHGHVFSDVVVVVGPGEAVGEDEEEEEQ